MGSQCLTGERSFWLVDNQIRILFYFSALSGKERNMAEMYLVDNPKDANCGAICVSVYVSSIHIGRYGLSPKDFAEIVSYVLEHPCSSEIKELLKEKIKES